MSTTTAQPPLKLQVTRLIKVPRERVFAAWTTPADITKWLSCGNSKARSVEVDLRIGGKYQVNMESSECGTMQISGVYREIKSPSRLVFTWGWEEADAKRIDTIVTVDLIDRNGSTEVNLSHEGFTDEESRDKHEFGWNSCLDNFAKLA